MTERQRLICRRAVLVGAVIGLVLCGGVAAFFPAVTSTPYRLIFVVSARSTSPAYARHLADRLTAAIDGQLQSHGLHVRRETSSRPARAPDGSTTGATVYAESLAVRSTDKPMLSAIAVGVQRSAAEPVLALNSTSQFRAVRRNGVQLWQLRSAGDSTSGAAALLQINGPAVVLGYADYLSLALFAGLIVSFASLEQRGDDPSSFPRGMHPALIGAQILLIALFACWLAIYWRVGAASSNIGLLAISALIAVSLIRWLLRTAPSWRAVQLFAANRALLGAVLCLFALSVYEALGR